MLDLYTTSWLGMLLLFVSFCIYSYSNALWLVLWYTISFWYCPFSTIYFHQGYVSVNIVGPLTSCVY